MLQVYIPNSSMASSNNQMISDHVYITFIVTPSHTVYFIMQIFIPGPKSGIDFHTPMT